MKTFMILSISTTLVLTSCAASDKPWEKDRDALSQMGDTTVKYTTPLAFAGAGAGAGYLIGKNTESTVIGGAAGGIVGLAANAINDGEKKRIAQRCIEYGEHKTIAEELNEQWKREAIYGMPRGKNTKSHLIYRTVYVPKRTINGVEYQGGYQTVPIYE